MAATPKVELMKVKEAAAKYKIPEPEIRELIEAGRLDLYTVDDSEHLEMVAKDEIASLYADRYVRREDFSHLEGIEISISEASFKYAIHVGTLSKWVKEGRIRKLRDDPHHKQRKFINEADVAYLAKLSEMKGRRPGRKLE
jgi:hypothetical protein